MKEASTRWIFVKFGTSKFY